MRVKDRKVRLAIVLGIAVLVAFMAWRSERTGGLEGPKPCVAGRQEEKDSTGKVVRITNTYCG